jgi:hypothetical protein
VSEQTDSSSADTAHLTASAEAAATRARFERRRRLLKVGAGAAPVALTLSSRPVLAWHCNTASAWGSAQMLPNQSTTARNSVTQLSDDTWTVTNWCTNSTGIGTLGLPWSKLAGKPIESPLTLYGTGLKAGTPRNAFVAGYTCTTLFGSSPLPAGCTGGQTVWSVLKSGSQFQQRMVAAKLNAKLITNVAACLKSNGTDQLSLMMNGSYTPPNAKATTWGQSQIITYLDTNYIAKP